MDVATPWHSTAFSLLIANLLHTMIGLVWISGLRRVSGPLPADLHARLLEITLVFPAVITLFQLVGTLQLPETWTLLRVEAWVAGLEMIRSAYFAIFIGFLAAIALIFFLQEFMPFWMWRHGRLTAPRAQDPRLARTLERVYRLYEDAGVPRPRGHKVRAFRLETDMPVAALHGVVEPELLVSRGLLAILTDDELEATVAHEMGHVSYGGNLSMFITWIFRALQAPNPAALVVFRSLVETRELACDALAAWVTKKPVALASAILKVYEGGVPGSVESPAEHATAQTRPGLVATARDELIRKAETMATRYRVEALLNSPPARPTSGLLVLLTGLILVAIMWVIQ